MADTAERAETLDIRELLAVLRRRWWIIAAVAGVAVVAALALSLREPELYSASTQVRLTDPNSQSITGNFAGWTDPQRQVDTQLAVLASPIIAEAANEALGDKAGAITGLSFSGVGETDVVQIQASSQDPAVAQAAADAYANAYVENAQRQSSGSLQDRAEELRSSADELDSEIAALEEELDAADPADTAGLQSRLTDLQSQRNAATAQQASYRSQAAELEVQAAQGGEGAAAASSAAANLRYQADVLQTEIEALNAEVDSVNAELSASEAAQNQIDDLEAQKTALLQQQSDFRQRASEFDVEAAVREGDVQVIAAAGRPTTPFAPTPERDALFALILAVFAGVGLVFLVERLDDRLRAGDDVQELFGAPVLGSVLIDTTKKRSRLGALPKAARHLVAIDSLDSEAYRTLATSLRFSNLGQDKQVVAVSSASGAEGKSTVTANVAATLADAGLSVALVSSDLRRPAIGEVFEVAETKHDGLSSVLLGDARVMDVIVPVDIPSGKVISFIPSGPVPTNPAELLGSRRMEELLTELGERFDYVLLDCPPILPVSDVLSIAQFVDGVVMIAVPGRSRTHQLAEACDRLHKVGADILGVVLNGVPRQPGRYGYYHYYRRYEPATTTPDQRVSNESERVAEPPLAQRH